VSDVECRQLGRPHDSLLCGSIAPSPSVRGNGPQSWRAALAELDLTLPAVHRFGRLLRERACDVTTGRLQLYVDRLGRRQTLADAQPPHCSAATSTIAHAQGVERAPTQQLVSTTRLCCNVNSQPLNLYWCVLRRCELGYRRHRASSVVLSVI